jgi:hypothetical protein
LTGNAKIRTSPWYLVRKSSLGNQIKVKCRTGHEMRKGRFFKMLGKEGRREIETQMGKGFCCF